MKLPSEYLHISTYPRCMLYCWHHLMYSYFIWRDDPYEKREKFIGQIFCLQGWGPVWENFCVLYAFKLFGARLQNLAWQRIMLGKIFDILLESWTASVYCTDSILIITWLFFIQPPRFSVSLQWASQSCFSDMPLSLSRMLLFRLCMVWCVFEQPYVRHFVPTM